MYNNRPTLYVFTTDINLLPYRNEKRNTFFASACESVEKVYQYQFLNGVNLNEASYFCSVVNFLVPNISKK